MDKRPYAAPRIIRVKLEHQQAVLAACSTTATTLSVSHKNLNCKPLTGTNCKKDKTAAGRDSQATS